MKEDNHNAITMPEEQLRAFFLGRIGAQDYV
jgi:hypothetical protein